MDHARNFGDKQRGRYARTLLPVRGRPPAWRWFSNLRVHGTFLSRVPVRHATTLMPSPIFPISCSTGGANRCPTGKKETRDWKVPGTRRQECRRYDFRFRKHAPPAPAILRGNRPLAGRSGEACCQALSNHIKPLFLNTSSKFVKIRAIRVKVPPAPRPPSALFARDPLARALG
jgi:hypothetical protein